MSVYGDIFLLNRKQIGAGWFFEEISKNSLLIKEFEIYFHNFKLKPNFDTVTNIFFNIVVRNSHLNVNDINTKVIYNECKINMFDSIVEEDNKYLYKMVQLNYKSKGNKFMINNDLCENPTHKNIKAFMRHMESGGKKLAVCSDCGKKADRTNPKWNDNCDRCFCPPHKHGLTIYTACANCSSCPYYVGKFKPDEDMI